MIDLYAAPTANGLRAKIMLDECGLEYRLHPINIREGANRTPAYLKINPMGLIPAIVDPDGPDGKPVTLSQSTTILIYLAGKAGRFLPESVAQDMSFWQDFMSIGVDMSGALQAILTLGREAEPHRPSMDVFGKRFGELLKVWDAKLGERPYCGGCEVTIADFAFFTVMYRCKAANPEYAGGCANVDRWQAEIGARHGVMKGLDFG